jgi:hypothetical protein
MLQKIKVGAIAAIGGILASASFANALDWTGVTLSTADVDSLMLLVIGALATLWAYRKVIKVMNRS